MYRRSHRRPLYIYFIDEDEFNRGNFSEFA